MPAKPRWWQHIPEIRAMLVDAALPVIDRAAIERLFGLGRRQAITLMHEWGGYQAGRTFLIGQHELIRQLDAIAQTGEYDQETRRRERLSSRLEMLWRSRQAQAIRIPVSPEAFDGTVAKLAPGVQLQPGRLTVDFAGPEDLLRQLFTLARAVANDYSAFESAVMESADASPVVG